MLVCQRVLLEQTAEDWADFTLGNERKSVKQPGSSILVAPLRKGPGSCSDTVAAKDRKEMPYKGRNSDGSYKRRSPVWALLPEGTHVSRPPSQSEGDAWIRDSVWQGCSLCPSSWRATFMTKIRGLLLQVCLLCNSRSYPQPQSKQCWDGWWCTGVINHRQAEECSLGTGAFCIWISEARAIISSSRLTLLVKEARQLQPVSPGSPASCMWLTPQQCSAPLWRHRKDWDFPPLSWGMCSKG